VVEECADADGDGAAGADADGDTAVVLAGPAAATEPAATVPQPARLTSAVAVRTDRGDSKLAKRLMSMRTVASWHERPRRFR
jgi:hypothetical protein